MISVDVTIKKISSRKITSAIDDIENAARGENCCFSAKIYCLRECDTLQFQHVSSEIHTAGSLSISINSMVLLSRSVITLPRRDTR